MAAVGAGRYVATPTIDRPTKATCSYPLVSFSPKYCKRSDVTWQENLDCFFNLLPPTLTFFFFVVVVAVVVHCSQCDRTGLGSSHQNVTGEITRGPLDL